MLDLPTDRVAEADLEDVLWHDAAGIDILFAPPRVEMAEMVLARDLEKSISLLRRLYELIVVDVGVNLDEVTLSLLDQADTILHIVTYDGTTLRNTVAMAETFAKIGYPPTKVRYLVNRADAAAGIDPAEFVARVGREPDFRVRSDGKVVVPAGNRGQPFVLSDPDALVSRDVIEIARRLSPVRARQERPAAAAAR
jgi:pilus assembly protein CpaE